MRIFMNQFVKRTEVLLEMQNNENEQSIYNSHKPATNMLRRLSTFISE